MEDTQAVNWEVEEEEETKRPNESLGCSLEPVGRLHIFSSAHGPEKDFPLYLGKNMVGRMPDCSVTLPFSSISKQHAVIEIAAWDKAPVLQDCGSLNGTQVLRPPKVLSPGVSHRLRDQELILFADLPCQYHRLNVPLPFVSRGFLTVEETPRVQGGTQPQRLLLAEDSEEEVDSPSERCVMKEPRTSPLAAVVPESDEEGPSPAPDGRGLPFAFNLDSDTDEEESQHPAAGEASLAARTGSTAETEQPKVLATEIQLEKDQCSVKERNNDTKVEKDARNEVAPLGATLERNQTAGEDSDTDMDESRPAEVHLERSQPSGVIDSDTDVEEEGIPATPAVVPMKRRQIFHGVSTESPQAPALVHLQESPPGSDMDVEQSELQLAVPPERNQASVVIDSNTDDEEEVLAALTLARLKESRADTWSRDTDVEEDRAQPVALLEQSRTSAGRDSDTDVEEERIPMEKRGTVPKCPTDKAHSEKRQSPLRDSELGVDKNKSSLGVHLERSQASATVDNNTQVEEKALTGPAVTLVGKRQVPAVRTSQTDAEVEGGPAKPPVMHPEEAPRPPLGDRGTDAEEGTSLAASAVADTGKCQFLAKRDAGTEWAAAVLERERALEARAQDSEDLDLQATQCFVERENQSPEAVQSMEDEATQAFLVTLPQEPGPSCCSFQAPGALDEPWEVLATQPFCPTESEASEPQPVAALLDAHGSCPSTPRTTPQAQRPESPIHEEPLGIQGRGMQTVQKDMGTPREAVGGVAPERGPLNRETKSLPAGERGDVIEEEALTRGIQVLAGDNQGQESDQKVKSASIKRKMESLNIEIEIPSEVQEEGIGRETFEREAEKLVLERGGEPSGLGIEVPEVKVERSPQRGETGKGSQDQEGQASSLTTEPTAGTGDHQTLASAPGASGSQSGGAPMSPRRQQRGHMTCKMPPSDKASVGDQESADACLPPAVPEASTPHQNPLLSQSRKHPVPQSFLSPSLSSLEPIPRTTQNGNQEVPETPLSSEMEPFHPKSKVRLRGSSRKTPSTISSLALEPHSTIPTDQPLSPKLTSRVTRGRTHRSSVKTPEPVVPTAPELQISTSKDQPITSESTLQVTRGRTHRFSVKTPELVVPMVPEVQPSTSKEQPVTAELVSQGRTRKSVKIPEPVVSPATRGRAHRSSVKSPKPVIPTAAELQPSTSKDQCVTPEPTSQVAWGRTRRSSVKTPEPTVPTAPELQPSTSKHQSVTPEPTSQVVWGRTRRSSVKTPEPTVSTAPELQPSTSKDQSVITEPTSGATHSRTHRPSVKTPEPIIPTAPEVQPSVPTDQPVIPKPTCQGRTPRSAKTPDPIVPTALDLQPTTPGGQPVTPKRTSRGRTPRSSSKTPKSVVTMVPELQASTPTDQPVTPKLTSQATRGRTQRSSIKTSEPVAPTAPEQPSISTDQPVTPEPTSRATRSRTHRSFVKIPQPTEPTAPDLESLTPTDGLVTPKAQGSQGKTLRSSTVSALPVLTNPEFQSPVPTDQPIPPEPIPQATCPRRLRATRKHGSLTAPIVCEPYSALPEPKSRSSRNQRQGAVRAVESLGTVPKPAFSQLPEAPTQATQIQNVEATGGSELTQVPLPKAAQSRKRPLATVDKPPLQKRLQRGEVTQKTVFLKEEKEDPMERPRKEEDVVVPGPGKRKRDQAKEEPKGIPSRNLRRTKPNQESTAPKVLFTGVVDARGERAVLALGGSLASSVAEASHLVTDRVRRTVKFLCALGRGIPILSLDWLHQSRKAGCFLPPDEYVVTDPEQEKNFGFSLRDALSRAQERRLLEGYEIHVTPGVQPPPPQMGEIISCCGGTVLPSMPRSYKPQRVVITCPQDFPRCSIPSRVGLPILSPEFLLTGVLKQEAKPEAFILSTLEMSSS
ncbi:mediator of DNA damage checkpoint protein 1 isoform X3 [Ailuropoda melanoleuca]|uniref:Mediator of DNA damage checkpoint protein 1 n=3 Tax=Ailuropoda melanoleuca TaxID=9646 RepID=G1M3I5_AILME|nr:mediator of DNA damage checkpoint protein 1 isoform X3 [Ailuropoda melanoleuca]XP_019665107.2 mediator of DNA damage checkpoint protein 1 isoform X3 [Ailuropoda melanoleuca]XP_019665108.2 mediator of DNA damage checkpoint protein 1 isoform X3 [Ailuropoda melanoleuca]XP_034516333.1 mediator of DNA damage checkpoint protein 1 isoform X3 [Ailuropoda melanoleuca]